MTNQGANELGWGDTVGEQCAVDSLELSEQPPGWVIQLILSHIVSMSVVR